MSITTVLVGCHCANHHRRRRFILAITILSLVISPIFWPTTTILAIAAPAIVTVIVPSVYPDRLSPLSLRRWLSSSPFSSPNVAPTRPIQFGYFLLNRLGPNVNPTRFDSVLQLDLARINSRCLLFVFGNSSFPILLLMHYHVV